MSRFSDTSHLHQTAVPVFNQPPINPDVKILPNVENFGLIARIAKFWTKRLERRHMQQSIERLSGLSQHLLDDAGLTEAARTEASLDRDR